MAAPFAVLFISSPHRRGRRPVELPEGAVEELLIGKSVFFHDVGDGLLCVHQVLVDVGDADLVQVAEEGHPYIFLKNRQKASFPSPVWSAISWSVTGSI